MCGTGLFATTGDRRYAKVNTKSGAKTVLIEEKQADRRHRVMETIIRLAIHDMIKMWRYQHEEPCNDAFSNETSHVVIFLIEQKNQFVLIMKEARFALNGVPIGKNQFIGKHFISVLARKSEVIH